MVTVRYGQDTAGSRLSHSDMCTAGSGLFTEWLTRNITAWLAWPPAGVNQNSSVHPVRRCRTTGLNGPAEAHRGERLVPGQRGEHGLRLAQQRPPAEGSARGHPHAQPNQGHPAGDEAGHEPAALDAAAASGRTRASAAPAANSRPPRATERQLTESPLAVARHRIQPHPPGTRLMSTYPSRAQNTAPRTAMWARPAAGYAPLQTSTPAAHSTAPAAQLRCRHRCRGIRSAA